MTLPEEFLEKGISGERRQLPSSPFENPGSKEFPRRLVPVAKSFGH
jgi:hypothetical protein